MNRIAILALGAFLSTFVACGKADTKYAPSSGSSSSGNSGSSSGTTKTSKPAPAGIPQKYQTMLDRDWSKIQSLGAQFETQFKTAQATRGRDKAAVDAANDTYRELMDLWANISYAAQDDADGVQNAWAKHLRSHERTVGAWTKMNKGLKEFSRVK